MIEPAAARLASLLSWLARSFCFFLLVLPESSGPRWALLRPVSPVLVLVLLLAIFSHFPLTGRPSPASLPLLLLGSGSELCRFLLGPAILATFWVRTLPEQNQEELPLREHSGHKDC